MPQCPKIKFIVDYQKDINNCLSFLRWHAKDQPHYRRYFLPYKLHYILNKKVSSKERNKIIREYTGNYFSVHQQDIKRNVSQIEKGWSKVARRYYLLMDKVFKGYPWPKGNYRAIASIYNMFPRYINYKIFFFPPDSRMPNRANKIIAHEMTHFIFFDYLHKKYKMTEDFKIKGKPDNYVWLVSEIFNFTLESWAPYKKILKNEPRHRPYFGELKLCRKMHRDWQKKQDIDWLLYKWLK
jgi:hypothetical protein